jgi:hypothetical protein
MLPGPLNYQHYFRTTDARMEGSSMAPDHDSTDSDSRVYLLGLWRETTGSPWRATLRQAGSETRIAFADLEQLALFLLRLVDERGGVSGAEKNGSIYTTIPDATSSTRE